MPNKHSNYSPFNFDEYSSRSCPSASCSKYTFSWLTVVSHFFIFAANFLTSIRKAKKPTTPIHQRLLTPSRIKTYMPPYTEPDMPPIASINRTNQRNSMIEQCLLCTLPITYSCLQRMGTKISPACHFFCLLVLCLRCLPVSSSSSNFNVACQALYLITIKRRMLLAYGSGRLDPSMSKAYIFSSSNDLRT